MNVFLLYHTATYSETEEDVKLIGVFSSQALAERAMEEKKNERGFRDHPHGFLVDELTVDRLQWSEGFGGED